MSRRIRIEIAGKGTFYPAAVNQPTFLTTIKEHARRYHGPLNADEAIRVWTGTLSVLGFPDFDIWHEDASA